MIALSINVSLPPHPEPQSGAGVPPASTTRKRQARRLPLGFGHYPQNSPREANPQGWQKVAGGRSGQGGNDHRKDARWSRTPERGARRKEVFTAWPHTVGRLTRSSHSKYLAVPQRQSRARLAAMNLAPRRGAGPCLRRCPEVAAPINPRRPPATVCNPSG